MAGGSEPFCFLVRESRVEKHWPPFVTIWLKAWSGFQEGVMLHTATGVSDCGSNVGEQNITEMLNHQEL